jgi:hypothetical protein
MGNAARNRDALLLLNCAAAFWHHFAAHSRPQLIGHHDAIWILIMVSTLNALLSRNIPLVLAKNLVLAKKTLGGLAKMDDNELKKLGLEEAHIVAIRDDRPPIPTATLKRLFEESWRICCICHKRERGIVVHHIKEWRDRGTHDEDNLAVLCLIDHDRAHISGGLAKKSLAATDIREAKQKWIKQAKRIRDSYCAALLSPYNRQARWFWIHLDRLRAMTQNLSCLYIAPIDSHTKILFENGFIEEKGHIAPEDKWQEDLTKSKKYYVFDSSRAQKMAIYVSDVLGRLIQNSGVLDITDMMQDKDGLKSYVSNGMLVFFRSQIDILKNPDGYPNNARWLQGSVSTTDVRLTFVFDLWTSLSMTSMGTHLPEEAERSVIGEVTAISTVGSQTRVTITPLGISPNFLLHDPSQGAWVSGADNTDYKKRCQRAKM